MHQRPRAERRSDLSLSAGDSIAAAPSENTRRHSKCELNCIQTWDAGVKVDASFGPSGQKNWTGQDPWGFPVQNCDISQPSSVGCCPVSKQPTLQWPVDKSAKVGLCRPLRQRPKRMPRSIGSMWWPAEMFLWGKVDYACDCAENICLVASLREGLKNELLSCPSGVLEGAELLEVGKLAAGLEVQFVVKCGYRINKRMYLSRGTCSRPVRARGLEWAETSPPNNCQHAHVRIMIS